MTIQYRGFYYEIDTDAELAAAVADIKRRNAAREATREAFLSGTLCPLPTPRRRVQRDSILANNFFSQR